MNVIVPLAGKGERFRREGYTDPKPLIQVCDKRIIEHVIDNIVMHDPNVLNSYYVFYADEHTAQFIAQKYPFIHLVYVGETRGAAETLYRGIQHITKGHPS